MTEPLPSGARPLLLALLDLAYPGGSPQRQLQDAPDGAIAWQVQSLLDDFSDHQQMPEMPAVRHELLADPLEQVMRDMFGVERRT
jgi:hypothetical protein